MVNMDIYQVKWFLFSFMCYLSVAKAAKDTYIVHIDPSELPDFYASHLEWYSSMVNSVLSRPESFAETMEDPLERIMYSYGNAFHGFAARLTDDEAMKLEEEKGVVAVLPDTVYQLHTTRSPDFLGIRTDDSTSVWSGMQSDHEVVVGVLDTGIWPESESFNDTGMSPVPAHWKGICEVGRGFTKRNCNRKIIGARMFYRGYEASSGRINEREEYKSPRDQDGHGTHTAATAAGIAVEGANLLGYAQGTARGMAPKARIAAYKVCWTGGCFSSDILSAVDQAVADGVNVLSISLGGAASSYTRDSLAIAAFGAMENGVFVSCSAGNGGPEPVSLMNVSPWIMTVGAGTMDRDFPAFVKLGTNRTISGVSLYKGRMNLSTRKQYQLVYLGSNSSNPTPSSLCLEGTLDRSAVAGKIVICDRGISPRVQKGEVVKNAGGVGMILANTLANGDELVADCHLLPAVAVGATAGKEIKQYALRKTRATATLEFHGTKLGIKPSPVVASFSSRGPNVLNLEILKPDVIAPGVNILAAWTGSIGPSGLPTDHRRVKFNILSGTSMSCPHVSGIAALLKARHPEWSPAAIKSALMTTAYIHDNTFKPLDDSASGAPSNPFIHGAGHINPSRALNPGLVYDIGAQDYFSFLCTLKLSPMQLKPYTKSSNHSCHHVLASTGDLNYPAISAVFPERPSVSVLTLHRTVTNVGTSTSTYRLHVSPLKGVTVDVEPKVLHFTSINQKLSYKITFATKSRQPEPIFGALMWTDGVHRVRSPIAVTWLPPV
ncbi:hypothetical protein ACHQM5_000979 [Ranunculus cassubicifolius]